MGWFNNKNISKKKYFKSFEESCNEAKSLFENNPTEENKMLYYNNVKAYISHINTSKNKASGLMLSPDEWKILMAEYNMEIEKAKSVIDNELYSITNKLQEEKNNEKLKENALNKAERDSVAKRYLRNAPLSPLTYLNYEPVYFLDGRFSNLYVYPDFILIDRTRGGIGNIGNKTYKIIPIKYITGIQIKSTGLTTGFIEFSTYGHENTELKGFERVDDENNVNFGTEESALIAQSVIEYLLPKII